MLTVDKIKQVIHFYLIHVSNTYKMYALLNCSINPIPFL